MLKKTGIKHKFTKYLKEPCLGCDQHSYLKRFLKCFVWNDTLKKSRHFGPLQAIDIEYFFQNCCNVRIS